jgi:hypothetical protein
MPTLGDLISQFVRSVESGSIEVYNEFSLQYELGLFLRSQLPDRKVQFERNVRFFFPAGTVFTKREIDISIYSPEKRELSCAVELKYPRNGQYPEQMFSFCRDVMFVEQLRRAGFNSAGFVVFAEDPLFYQGASEGIYCYFRGKQALHGRIQKPTGRRDEEIFVEGTYPIEWKSISGPLKYAMIEVV